MPPMNLSGVRIFLACAALLAVSAVSAVAAPAFWGVTYAYTRGPDDPANLSGGRPVHVDALMAGPLSCMTLVSARLDDPPPYPLITNSLRAARVIVTIAPSDCPPPDKKRWLHFVVPHPVQADILNLVYVSSAGKPLGNEKVSIAGGTGGPYGD